MDLVVIGTGPGGEALATGAAKAGLEVVAVDKHLVGGGVPLRCIPTKMMVPRGDVVAEEVRRAGESRARRPHHDQLVGGGAAASATGRPAGTTRSPSTVCRDAGATVHPAPGAWRAPVGVRVGTVDGAG